MNYLPRQPAQRANLQTQDEVIMWLKRRHSDVSRLWSELHEAYSSFFFGIGQRQQPSSARLWSLIQATERYLGRAGEHYGLQRDLGWPYVVWQLHFVPKESEVATRQPFVEKALAHFEQAARIAKSLKQDTRILSPTILDTSEGREFAPEERPFLIVAWDILQLLKEAYWWKGEWRPYKIIEYAEPIVRSSKRYHPAHLFLGEAYCDLGNLAEAERVWKHAATLLEAAPALLSAIRSLPGLRARRAKERDDWEGVVAALSTREAREARSFDDLSLLWRALSFLNRQEDIPTLCREIVALATSEQQRRPLYASELKLLGDAYYELGLASDARLAWQRAQDLNPKVGVKRRLQSLKSEKQGLS